MQHPADSASRLGLLIQEARHSQNLSLRQLEVLADVPRPTLQVIESGKIQRPRPDILLALSTALSIPLADLYAAADYVPSAALPSLRPYLQARYPDFSPESIDKLTRYFLELAEIDGLKLNGPPDHEDENR